MLPSEGIVGQRTGAPPSTGAIHQSPVLILLASFNPTKRICLPSGLQTGCTAAAKSGRSSRAVEVARSKMKTLPFPARRGNGWATPVHQAILEPSGENLGRLPLSAIRSEE